MSYAKQSEAGSNDGSSARVDFHRFAIALVIFGTVGTISTRSATPFPGLRSALMRGAGT